MNRQSRKKQALTLFVTVGTTQFDELVSAVCSPSALKWMHVQGFTKLVVQYGKGKPPEIPTGWEDFPEVVSFDFLPSLNDFMSSADLIISHAGAGTIMEALKLEKNLVVVINDLLMDNHQLELGYALAERGHLLVVENVLHLQKSETWSKFENLSPRVFEGGDKTYFPSLLNSFLGYGTNQDTNSIKKD